jgi:hypothetical protein
MAVGATLGAGRLFSSILDPCRPPDPRLARRDARIGRVELAEPDVGANRTFA